MSDVENKPKNAEVDQVVKRNQPPVPSYFQLDERKKEEFLSQLGNFSSDERRLFHNICGYWEPVLDYDRFIKESGSKLVFSEGQVETLMHRLAEGHSGLLKVKFEDKQIKPDKIILTDRGDICFYMHNIENEMLKLMHTDKMPYLDEQYLAANNAMVPKQFVDNLGKEQIAQHYIEEIQSQVKIFRIKIGSESPLVCTSGSLGDLIKLSRRKLKLYLSNSDVLTFVSRLMSTVVSDIQKGLTKSDIHFWIKLTETVYKSKEDFLVKFKNIRNDLFKAARIIHAYAANEQNHQQALREEEDNKREEIINLCEKLYKDQRMMFSQLELNEMLEPYAEKWPDFKDLFYATSINTNAKTGLPTIVLVGNFYIHRDHIYPVFKEKLSVMYQELLSYYLFAMTIMIKSNNRRNSSVFASRSAFLSDIESRISDHDKFLTGILKKPRILFEAIIHFAKEKLKMSNMDQIQEIHHRYLVPGKVQYRELDNLLNLNMILIFKTAYDELPVWRKIFMKIMGRYTNYVKQFSGKSSGAEKSGAQDKKTSTISPRERDRNNNYAVSTGRSSSHGMQGSRKSSQSESKKNDPRYSIKQQEEAWSEFQQAFKKKK